MNLLPESWFNSSETMDIVRKLSFPRLIGSEGKIKAIEITKKDGINIEVKYIGKFFRYAGLLRGKYQHRK